MQKLSEVKFSELEFVKMGKCTLQLRQNAKYPVEYASDITKLIASLCGYKLIFTDLCTPFEKGFIDILMLFRNESMNGRKYVVIYLDMAGALLAERPEEIDVCYPTKIKCAELNVPNREICFADDIYPVSDLAEIADRESYLEQCEKNRIKLKAVRKPRKSEISESIKRTEQPMNSEKI